MIGEIRKALTPFYDKATHKMSIKSRPALIIAAADSDDYIVLPISKISDSRRIHPEYDIKLDSPTYTELNLKCVSYVRTHKQTIMHSANIGDKIADLKSSHPDLYIDIVAKNEKFNKEITQQALSVL